MSVRPENRLDVVSLRSQHPLECLYAIPKRELSDPAAGIDTPVRDQVQSCL